MSPKKSGPKAKFPDMNTCSPKKPTKDVPRETLLEIYESLTKDKRTNINESVKTVLEKALRDEYSGLDLNLEWVNGPTGTVTSLKITNNAVKEQLAERKKS